MNASLKKIVALLRISMGWIFLWAFFDKLCGLGFATPKEAAWLSGGSPTSGFLTHATTGPFMDFFQSLAGSPFVDWLFMLGLLGVGVGLLFGIAVKLSSYVGAFILLLMYVAGFMPPEHNPFMDDHLIYAFLMFVFALSDSGYTFGCAKKWRKTAFVRKFPLFE